MHDFMPFVCKRLALSALLAIAGSAALAQTVDRIDCQSCAQWNAPQAPFKVVGNTYYVGTQGLSALLITSDKGHILLDGGLPQSAPLIAANIETLGFKLADVKYILNSHAHWDHAGGIPALRRASGAAVVASEHGAKVLRDGVIGDDDPQHEHENTRFTPLAKVRTVKDGDVLRLGALAVTAHLTPGHTPGSTTWSWNACEGERCYRFVYADSLTAVSADGFRYSGGAGKPDLRASFRATIHKVRKLSCDVIVSTHPGFTDTLEKLARRTAEHNPFIDPQGCRTYADNAARAFEARLLRERGQP
jgi:metallo-beta-lactamase class B